MPPELLIPGLLTFLSLIHHVDLVSGLEGNDLARNQVLTDYMVKAWGGRPGVTPRSDPRQSQFEGAILHWAQALAETEALLRPFGGRGR